MAKKYEINVLAKMLQRAIQEENTCLEQTMPFCENGTEYILDRIANNGEMITDLAKLIENSN